MELRGALGDERDLELSECAVSWIIFDPPSNTIYYSMVCCFDRRGVVHVLLCCSSSTLYSSVFLSKILCAFNSKHFASSNLSVELALAANVVILGRVVSRELAQQLIAAGV